MRSSFSFYRALLLLICVLSSSVQSFSGVGAFFQTSPYATAAMVHGVKGIFADFVAQRHQLKQRGENRENLEITMNSNGLLVANKIVRQKIDLKRSFASLIYGVLYNGFVLEHSYNHI